MLLLQLSCIVSLAISSAHAASFSSRAATRFGARSRPDHSAHEDGMPWTGDDTDILYKRDWDQTPELLSFVRQYEDGNENTVSLNMSLLARGCHGVRESTHVGFYTFTNGTTRGNTTVGDIKNDFKNLRRKLYSARRTNIALGNHTRTSALEILNMSRGIERSVLCAESTAPGVQGGGDIKAVLPSDKENGSGDGQFSGSQNAGLSSTSVINEELRRHRLWSVPDGWKLKALEFSGGILAAGASGLLAGVIVGYGFENNPQLEPQKQVATVAAQLSTLQTQTSLRQAVAQVSSVPGTVQQLAATSAGLVQQIKQAFNQNGYKAKISAVTGVVSTMAAVIFQLLLKWTALKAEEALTLNIALADMRNDIELLRDELLQMRQAAANPGAVATPTHFTGLLATRPPSLSQTIASSTMMTATSKATTSITTSLTTSQPPIGTSMPATGTCMMPGDLGTLFQRIGRGGSQALGIKPVDILVVPNGEVEMGLKSSALTSLLGACIAGGSG